jgi:hypothetical protein
MRHSFYKGPAKTIFTPSIPVLMHASVEARQVALEHYSTAETCRTCNLQTGAEGLWGSIAFNFKLDTFLSLTQNGRITSFNNLIGITGQFSSQLRHLCFELFCFEATLFRYNLSIPLVKKVEHACRSFKRFEKLETISLYKDIGFLPVDKPWETNLVDVEPEKLFAECDALLGLQGRIVGRWDGTRSRRSLDSSNGPLKEIERAHPGWKAPKLKFVRMNFKGLGWRM